MVALEMATLELSRTGEVCGALNKLEHHLNYGWRGEHKYWLLFEEAVIATSLSSHCHKLEHSLAQA